MRKPGSAAVFVVMDASSGDTKAYNKMGVCRDPDLRTFALLGSIRKQATTSAEDADAITSACVFIEGISQPDKGAS